MLLALANYHAAAKPGASPSEIQAALHGYYVLVIGFIEGMILLIAIMLGASTIVSEYELGSMELVFSSPASSKYFLVGKYMAALRQIVLLLFLSLPITAVGVTLGGATASQVLEHYFYILLHAAFVLAISFPVACLTKNVFRTITSVFGALAACYFFSFLFVASTSGGALMGAASGGPPPPLIGLIPFTEVLVLGRSVTIWGQTIPAWVLPALATLVMVRIFILSAGSVISKAGSKETFSLRIHVFALLALFAVTSWYSITGSGMPRMGVTTWPTEAIGIGVEAFALPSLVMIGYISAWGRAEERKFLADEIWNWREIFGGRPSGSLGYGMLCLAVSCLFATVTILKFTPNMFAISAGVLHVFSLGFAILGFGWLVGTMVDTAEVARRVVFAIAIFLLVITQVAGAVISLNISRYGEPRYVDLNFLAATGMPWAVIVKSVLLIAIGAGCYVLGERRRISHVQRLYGAPSAA